MQAAEQFVRREENDPAHWPKTNLTNPQNWQSTLGFTCSSEAKHNTDDKQRRYNSSSFGHFTNKKNYYTMNTAPST